MNFWFKPCIKTYLHKLQTTLLTIEVNYPFRYLHDHEPFSFYFYKEGVSVNKSSLLRAAVEIEQLTSDQKVKGLDPGLPVLSKLTAGL